MFAKVNSFGGCFGFAHGLNLGYGEVPDVLTAKQLNVVKSTWIETYHFQCLAAAPVKTLAEKIPNVQRVVVLEHGCRSPRYINWDDAKHVLRVVREALERK